MFVSRKTHEASLELLRQGHQQVLNCKNAHIDTLEQEIRFLRNMVQPQARSSAPQIEADLILEGRQDQVVADVSDKERQRAVDLEAARILDGTY